MRIIVKAKASAKTEKVERLTQPTLNFSGLKQQPEVYRVWIKESPVDGRANTAIVKALANYFKTAASNIRMISGQTSKQKTFEIDI